MVRSVGGEKGKEWEGKKGYLDMLGDAGGNIVFEFEFREMSRVHFENVFNIGDMLVYADFASHILSQKLFVKFE